MSGLQWLVAASYFIAATLFLLGLQRMASPRTARSGIQWAGVGMVLATVATFFVPGWVVEHWPRQCRRLVDAGHEVVAVEPNAAMREAAIAWLGGNPRFSAVDGNAEATTLADATGAAT